MPNLVPPVTTSAMAMAYKQRIEQAVPEARAGTFTPLMTMYLTDNTSPEDVREAKERGVVAFKMYPAGATTNSDSGVTDWKKCVETLKAMEEVRLREGVRRIRPRNVHGLPPRQMTAWPLARHHVRFFSTHPAYQGHSLFRNRATISFHVVAFPFRGESISGVLWGVFPRSGVCRLSLLASQAIGTNITHAFL